jgi:hypothetical protein
MERIGDSQWDRFRITSDGAVSHRGLMMPANIAYDSFAAAASLSRTSQSACGKMSSSVKAIRSPVT